MSTEIIDKIQTNIQALSHLANTLEKKLTATFAEKSGSLYIYIYISYIWNGGWEKVTAMMRTKFKYM